MCLQYICLENAVGKREIARYDKFLLFQQCFSTHLENFLPFLLNLKLLSENSLSLSFGKGLTFPLIIRRHILFKEMSVAYSLTIIKFCFICCCYTSILLIFMPPFNKVGVYCFAQVCQIRPRHASRGVDNPY